MSGIFQTIQKSLKKLVQLSENQRNIKNSEKLANSLPIQSTTNADLSGHCAIFLRSNILRQLSSFYSSFFSLTQCLFRGFLSLFSLKIQQIRRANRGYVLILTAIAIPVLLMGVKYSLDKLKEREIELERSGTDEYYKKCAREAALAVAQNWNPGLTLSQQKDGIYKVADAVYNAHPLFHKSPVGDAIPGLDMKKNYKIENNPELQEMEVSNESESVSKTVGYTTATKYFYN